MNKKKLSCIILLMISFPFYYNIQKTKDVISKKDKQINQVAKQDLEDTKKDIKNKIYKSRNSVPLKNYKNLSTEQVQNIINEIQDKIERSHYIDNANKGKLTKDEFNRFKYLLGRLNILNSVIAERTLEGI